VFVAPHRERLERDDEPPLIEHDPGPVIDVPANPPSSGRPDYSEAQWRHGLDGIVRMKTRAKHFKGLEFPAVISTMRGTGESCPQGSWPASQLTHLVQLLPQTDQWPSCQETSHTLAQTCPDLPNWHWPHAAYDNRSPNWATIERGYVVQETASPQVCIVW
jgi:hypothetical protein